MKNILVFTGGGLSPSLNPTIYGVTKAAQERGWSVVGGLYGWNSLLRNGRQISLDKLDLEPLRDVGGTILRSSRTNPLAVEDGVTQVKEKIKELGVDAVIAIGGNDTLGAAAKLAQAGVPIVGIPKTIDNDLAGTYYTPGFPSAAHYLANLVKEIKQDAAYALSRIFVIESLGMKAGWLAAAGVFGGADVIITPERKTNLKKTLSLLNERYIKNGNYAVVVVAQEAHFDEKLSGLKHNEIGEQYGHSRQNFICLDLKERISEELNIPTKAIYPGNFLETGKPTPLDRDMSILLGKEAVNLVDKNIFGKMVAIERKDAKSLKLEVAVTELHNPDDKGNYKPFPDNFFDFESMLPSQEFMDYMAPLIDDTPRAEDDYSRLLKTITSRS